MNLTSFAVLRVGVLLLTIGCGGCHGNSAETFNEFTQCIKGVDEPLARKERLYQDPERECYGVRWKIPHALPSSTTGTYGPKSQSVWITIDAERRRALSERGLHNLLPPIATSKIEVLPVFETPEAYIARSREVYVGGLHMRESPQRFGMNARNSTLKDHAEDVLLYPSDDATLFALCRPNLKADGSQDIERALCHVWSAFADHLVLRYAVFYPELARLREINDEMISWVRTFMPSGS